MSHGELNLTVRKLPPIFNDGSISSLRKSRWLVIAFALFAVTMFAVKTGMAAAMSAWGAWVGLVGIALAILISHAIDRSEARKRHREEEESELG
jgi:hypothetical protein